MLASVVAVTVVFECSISSADAFMPIKSDTSGLVTFPTMWPCRMRWKKAAFLDDLARGPPVSIP